MSTQSRTQAQRRAIDALDKTLAIVHEQATWAAAYRSYVERLPAAIVMNGLGQALATELAATRDTESSGDAVAHQRLFDNIADWLGSQIEVYTQDNLLHDVMANSEHHYLHAQAEALAWLEWHKKFCRAHLD
ncbi:MAG: type III-B CRISPR module-associated protein Cmr5 [Myxococcota bacterium]